MSQSTQRVVDYFTTFHTANGRRPTFKEACRDLAISSTSVISFHLRRAERLGVEIPGESSLKIDSDIRALAACVKALEACTPEGRWANLRYLLDRFGARGPA